MKQIRTGVFETNSSSTHSIVFCTKEEFETWKAGKTYFNEDCWSDSEFAGNQFVTMDQLRDIAEKGKYHPLYNAADVDEEIILGYFSGEVYTYDDYFHQTELEPYEAYYTTPKGEEIVAFGKYGYDG